MPTLLSTEEDRQGGRGQDGAWGAKSVAGGVEKLSPRLAGDKAVPLRQPQARLGTPAPCGKGLKLAAPWVRRAGAWAVPKQTRKGESL